jgi:hypothetical protein
MQPENPFYRYMTQFCKKKSNSFFKFFLKLDDITHQLLERLFLNFLSFILFFSKLKRRYRSKGGEGLREAKRKKLVDGFAIGLGHSPNAFNLSMLQGSSCADGICCTSGHFRHAKKLCRWWP